ncbi:hypothetical protein, partial [Streptomyces cacaoi]|uniref:hypothetical protein n=1 Tax=Streptomyces cacaoi TaxID=1898 RepID=UPI001F292678
RHAAATQPPRSCRRSAAARRPRPHPGDPDDPEVPEILDVAEILDVLELPEVPAVPSVFDTERNDT